MTSVKFYLLLLLLGIVSSTVLTEAHRILCIFPFNGKSHDVMFNGLIKGLTERNHQVDVITHYPMKNPPPNYKVAVNLSGTYVDTTNSLEYQLVKSLTGDIVTFVAEVFGNDVCRLLGMEEMQKFIKNLPKYDVLIVEVFGANCFLGFGHLLKVPVVGISTTIEYPWISDMIGSSENLALVQNSILTEFDKTKLWDRIKNVFSYYYSVRKFYQLTEKTQTDLMRKYLSPDIPSIREVEKNIALMLVNRHPVIYGTLPINPLVIEVSGLHIANESELRLPADLKKWLDNSTNGVVYFTFGSMILIETLPTKIITAIFKSLEKIAPTRILLKIVDKTKLPPGLPKNVMTSAWIPQQSVLAHKNVRAFVTHGGLMGCQEALYYGVPMIGIPLFADQGRNMRAFVAKDMAIKINFDNLTTQSLDEAFELVLKNPIYRKNAKLNSKLFRDRPIKAIDAAEFWIDYIVRNGPNTLKSPALEFNWWQLALLDVYAFILLCLILILVFPCLLIRLLVKKLLSLKVKSKKLD